VIVLQNRTGFRHLPPTAVKVQFQDLRRGFLAALNEKGAMEDFRTALSRRTDNVNCYLAPSGRAGLALILMGLAKTDRRRKVIVPAYVCPTVVMSVVRAGLEPVFCDLSPQTLDLDREAMHQLIDPEVLAIVPAHLYGWAQDVRDIVELGKRENIFVIEDAAQAYGAKFDGRMVGNLADAGYYSLGRGKCIPVGHGGIIVARDHIAEKIKDMIDSMTLKAPSFDFMSLALFFGYGLATQPKGWYLVSRTGLNPAEAGMDLTEIPPISFKGLSAAQAGIGTSILSRLEGIQATSARNARKLMERLAEFEFLKLPRIAPEAEPVFLRLPIILENEILANQVFHELSQVGIGVSRSYSRTLPDLYAQEFPAQVKVYPGAKKLADCLLTLPTHVYLQESDIERIVGVIKHIESQSAVVL
jgi:perosamine synthetase